MVAMTGGRIQVNACSLDVGAGRMRNQRSATAVDKLRISIAISKSWFEENVDKTGL